jgi:asparagine synthase (glutamine-hydrolysing)
VPSPQAIARLEPAGSVAAKRAARGDSKGDQVSMCGIAGALRLDSDARLDVERVRQMSDLLCHRGPDGEGLWTSDCGRVCFAHRRLAIIDLETGAQPMRSQNTGASIVFNGEIYNYLELRQQLESRGVVFRTRSDTEVLLNSVALEGLTALEPVHGMFAFAHWNPRSGELLLVRDRFGKKPLFHTIQDGVLYFASSLRALRPARTTTWAVDARAVADFLALGYIPAPRTIYEGVEKLEAGCSLRARVDGPIRGERFYDIANHIRPFGGSYAQAVDELDGLLHEATRLRLRSDVPLGVFLSGGIDSSLIAAIAAKQSATEILTFSIAFADEGYDESPFAAQVARWLGTRHQAFQAVPDILDFVPLMTSHFGEPFGDSSALNVWLLARETRLHVTVALGGDGGDEAFGGYNWYWNAARLNRLAAWVPGRPVRYLADMLDSLGAHNSGGAAPARVARASRILGEASPAARFAALRSFMGTAEKKRLYTNALRDVLATDELPAEARVAALYARAGGDAARRMRYADIYSYLADGLLPKVDVATMAHGLEARAPLLDHKVVEFGLGLPADWLHGEDGGKRILRDVLYRYLPRKIFIRPKQGFSVPLQEWFMKRMRGTMDALETSDALAQSGWIRRDGVRAMVREHLSGTRDHSQRLFNLHVLDAWLTSHYTSSPEFHFQEKCS